MLEDSVSTKKKWGERSEEGGERGAKGERRGEERDERGEIGEEILVMLLSLAIALYSTASWSTKHCPHFRDCLCSLILVILQDGCDDMWYSSDSWLHSSGKEVSNEQEEGRGGRKGGKRKGGERRKGGG